MFTLHRSDLMWRVHEVYHSNERYVKLKMSVFYKNTGNVCYWLNGYGRPKTFKIIRSVYDNWEVMND